MKKRIVIFSLIFILLVSTILVLILHSLNKKTDMKAKGTNKVESIQIIDEIDKAEDTETNINNEEDSIAGNTNNDITKVDDDKNNESINISSQENSNTASTAEIYTNKNYAPTVSYQQERKPWDDLGISEYDYYNKPDHKWGEVNFSIKIYGTRDATFKACQDYGVDYTNKNGGGFFCDSVNSYSGDYLGEIIEFY